MSHTSFTAVIFTFHNWSAIASLLGAIFMSFLAYFLILKSFAHRFWALIITFALAYVMSQAFMEKLFLQKPCGIEIVRAG